jgi:hypothetical protein
MNVVFEAGGVSRVASKRDGVIRGKIKMELVLWNIAMGNRAHVKVKY